MSTAVILAGGESRRMKRDKLALPYGASSLLASAVRRFSECFDTVCISVADAEKYPEIQAGRIVDIYKGCGPMGGLHAALTATEEEGVFLVAADLPYADPRAARRVMELAGTSDICITAGVTARYEPLFGYYKKTVLPHVAAALESGSYKLAALFDKVDVRIVSKSELGGLWHDKLLLNINYPEDYEKLIREKRRDL
ncbi:molybdopterin-guanine dinucleotide biosynthesis protein A [Sporobacter termitidis DSM 10068]|uniref:Molybdopterin-guanine dinucleotide biosynthesis protein A n=1 Tax=Sporobacter termitidis DSM 10068 TaxID=1123282 RepID=A0A1M5VE80_9FIRM|nr:molybdenum cofactor guanylyltransferase [Sporobacter termitidis]SHH73549.1 molybdopterin-guanine dinucleotide biosynthesis protein A [Sporobacter termitidis DSM 10068]